jgi:chemotaxis protein MotA
MKLLIGYLIVIISVFGGYVMSGGHMLALFQPYEFVIIVGAAVGAFIVSNSGKVIRASGKATLSCVKGHNFAKPFNMQLLSMFYELTNKISKEGILAIEADIENYKESALFQKYPLVTREQVIMEFLCDHLRIIITGRVSIAQLDVLLDQDIETYQSEAELPIAAISKTSDSMPAFGIVAAVMGVVITMSLVGGPPAELAHHVATALVGTFLGILIGYGFVSPIAATLENRLSATITILQSIKVVLLASVHNLAPTIAVEFSRKLLYSSDRPTSQELETMMRDLKTNKSGATDAPAEGVV